MSDKGEKDSSLSIPKILADFFLKKLDMSSDSEGSNHKHKNWKKKSKHKKHKHHKKSKNRFRHDSSDSTSKSSDLNSKDIVDDLSSSEEMGIKRLKKIKSMKFQPVNNSIIPSLSASDDPNTDKSGPSSSTASENLVYYGPAAADAATLVDKLPSENKENNAQFSSGNGENNVVNDSESTVGKGKSPDLHVTFEAGIQDTVPEGADDNNGDVVSNNNSSNNYKNDANNSNASLVKNSNNAQVETSQKEINVANTDENGEIGKGEQEKDPNSSVNQIRKDGKAQSRSRSRSKSCTKHGSPKSKRGKRSSRSSSRDSHKRKKRGSRSRSRSRKRFRGHGHRRSRSRDRSKSRGKKHRRNSRSLSPRGRFSRRKIRSRSRSHGRHKKHSHSRSRSHSHGKRKNRLHSRSRSKSHGKHKKHSHSRSRSKSRGKQKKHSHSRSRSKSRGKQKKHSHSRSRSKSRGKQKKHSHSRSRSKSHGKQKKPSHSRSRSKSQEKSKKHSHSRSRSKSKEKQKKHSHSRSRSKSKEKPKKHSHSRSRSKSHGKHKKHSHSRSRSRSHHRNKRHLHKRSRSRSHGRHKKHLHGRSRSRSHGRSRRHLHSRSRSRSHGRRRNRSDSRTRTHSGHIEGFSSKDKDQSNPRRKSRSRSNSRSKRKSDSREKSRSKSISKEPKSNKIDQAKILATARKNVLKMMKDGTLPEGLPVENIVKEQFVSIQGGGKSVQELTDFCQRLSQQENELESSDKEDKDDKPDDETGFIHHPFKVKEPGMIKLNIKNAVQLPIKTHAQKIAETTRLSSQFPVSSGNQHKQKELEWIPVVPETTKKETKPAVMTVATIPEPPKSVPVKTEPPVSSIPIPVSYPVVAPEPPPPAPVETPPVAPPLLPPPLPPPPPPMPSLLRAHLQPPPVFQPPVQPVAPSYIMPNHEVINSYEPPPPTTISTSTSVFKPPKKLDIPAIVAKRFQALTKLQENPNDPEALKTIHDAQESIQEWVESQQVPGLFTGSTDAKVLSAAELCGPFRYHKFKKDFLIHAPPVTEGKGMSLLKKMGWNPGEGLGKNKEGSLEPLMLDIKTDKKGLVSEGENSKKGVSSFTKELQGKHPVSALMELCSKRKWKPPLYTCVLDQGPSHRKHFCFKVEVNGVKYQPLNPSANKKIAKADAAVLCLQSLNILPKTA